MKDTTLMAFMIVDRALHTNHTRPGQELFNSLPTWVGNRLAGLHIDPFHNRDIKTVRDVQHWIDHHLIFDDDGQVIALFNYNEVLAERPAQ